MLYRELMETENESRVFNCARMKKPAFFSVVKLLVANGGLRDMVSANPRNIVSAGEIVMICLYILKGKKRLFYATLKPAKSWQKLPELLWVLMA